MSLLVLQLVLVAGSGILVRPVLSLSSSPLDTCQVLGGESVPPIGTRGEASGVWFRITSKQLVARSRRSECLARPPRGPSRPEFMSRLGRVSAGVVVLGLIVSVRVTNAFWKGSEGEEEVSGRVSKGFRCACMWTESTDA